MRKLFLGMVAAGMISGIALANANSQTGCGLGSMVITQPNSAILYALQMTTNQSTGTQSFGITSGTMNCRKAKFVHNTRVQEFVAANMDVLHKEIAKGDGQSLDALVELLDIKESSTFKTKLQENYLAIYKHSDTDMASALDSIHNL